MQASFKLIVLSHFMFYIYIYMKAFLSPFHFFLDLTALYLCHYEFITRLCYIFHFTVVGVACFLWFWHAVESLSSGYGETIEQREMVLGSKPPGCVNKCLNCRPCMATLVIPHQRNGFSAKTRGEDDSYYLLSWKCRCGNKLYQP